MEQRELKNEEKGRATINHVHLLGYVGDHDASVGRTQTGKHRAYFSMATGGGSRGERHYPPEWHQVVAWGHLAASCDVVKQGLMVEVEGRLSYYQDKSGRYTAQISAFKILVNGLDILEPQAHMFPRPEDPISDDDIPF